MDVNLVCPISGSLMSSMLTERDEVGCRLKSDVFCKGVCCQLHSVDYCKRFIHLNLFAESLSPSFCGCILCRLWHCGRGTFMIFCVI